MKLVLRESISPRIHSILSLGLNFGYRDHNHWIFGISAVIHLRSIPLGSDWPFWMGNLLMIVERFHGVAIPYFQSIEKNCYLCVKINLKMNEISFLSTSIDHVVHSFQWKLQIQPHTTTVGSKTFKCSNGDGWCYLKCSPRPDSTRIEHMQLTYCREKKIIRYC